jgi:hypothetical protein
VVSFEYLVLVLLNWAYPYRLNKGDSIYVESGVRGRQGAIALFHGDEQVCGVPLHCLGRRKCQILPSSKRHTRCLHLQGAVLIYSGRGCRADRST